jgi:hypothetical protein
VYVGPTSLFGIGGLANKAGVGDGFVMPSLFLIGEGFAGSSTWQAAYAIQSFIPGVPVARQYPAIFSTVRLALSTQ